MEGDGLREMGGRQRNAGNNLLMPGIALENYDERNPCLERVV